MSQGSEQLYINSVDGITAIVFVGLSTSSTTSPSPTTPTMEDETTTVIIIIIALMTFVLMIIFAVVVCVAIKYVQLKYMILLCCYLWKNFDVDLLCQGKWNIALTPSFLWVHTYSIKEDLKPLLPKKYFLYQKPFARY